MKIQESFFSGGSNITNGNLENLLRFYLKSNPVFGMETIRDSNSTGYISPGGWAVDGNAIEDFSDNIPYSLDVSGVGGLSQGSVKTTNAWYGVYAIAGKNKKTNSLLHQGATAPTLPTGYDRKRLVGWLRTDASSIIKDIRLVVSNGRYREYSYEWVTSSTAYNTTVPGSPTFVDIDFTGFVPPGCSQVRCGLRMRANTSTFAFFAFRPKGATVTQPAGQFNIPAPAVTPATDGVTAETWLTLGTGQMSQVTCIQSVTSTVSLAVNPVRFRIII